MHDDATSDCLHIKGARQHNLKNIELRLPRNRLVAVTGVSGSGKSSLVFDTLYAEGYRQFIDSLSPRARQVLAQLPRPDVDFIHGLSPVIAVEQRETAGANPRGTVATVTELADYARLVWALRGQPHCPRDGAPVRRFTLEDCLQRICAEPAGARLQILAPYMRSRPAVLRDELPHLAQRGYQRVRVAGRIGEIDDPRLLPGGRDEVDLDIVIDRLVLHADQRSRLADALELAFREGGDKAVVLVGEADADRAFTVSRHHACTACGEVYPPITAKSFSYDHPDGACPLCGGLGRTLQFVDSLVVPNPSLGVRKGAIKPWRLGSRRMIIERNALLKQLAEQLPFDPQVPWRDLPEPVRQQIMHGCGDRMFHFKTGPGGRKGEDRAFAGVLADLERTRRETRSDGLRHRLLAYQIQRDCPQCGCSRLRPESRAVRLDGCTYPDFMRMDIAAARAFAETMDTGPLGDAVQGLRDRLRFLHEVGLGYLTLDRAYASLSGGEAQRLRLATQLGMGLVGVTYILDEPTIGLHPRDTARLRAALAGLRDRGNSVIVVEHDAELLLAADHLVEIGPGAGAAGGEVIYSGSVAAALADARCLAGRYLSGAERIEKDVPARLPGSDWIEVLGATEHNLANIDARFPVGLLSVVTGISGSGKSTLVHDILAQSARLRLNRAKTVPGRHRALNGLDHFDRVVLADQEPIGRSPRSNPATFTKIFDELRKLFARCPLAKVRGYGPGRFSFNVRGGRCERCQGDGQIRLDMHFLSDVYVECPSCAGRRYNRETLEVRYRGLSIADVLNLSIHEAEQMFSAHTPLRNRFATLTAVGLGYLRLGQAANTLSGGEAQRLKLSLELGKGRSGRTLYILDEPTTGLHWRDIQLLLNLLFRLRDQGHTLIIIEHHPDVVALADWVIDLGPGGGNEGGRIVYAGPVDGLRRCTASHTGACLAAGEKLKS
jgi:excinuclease ABC subunit A